jgi:hypothetical protein
MIGALLLLEGQRDVLSAGFHLAMYMPPICERLPT